MEFLGIVKKVDKLNRISIPKELRESLGLHPGTPVEFFATSEGLYIRKYTPNNTPFVVIKEGDER